MNEQIQELLQRLKDQHNYLLDALGEAYSRTENIKQLQTQLNKLLTDEKATDQPGHTS